MFTLFEDVEHREWLCSHTELEVRVVNGISEYRLVYVLRG